MDDQIIDLGEYVRQREEEASSTRNTFALWGGDGERARFALPLWRATYLAKGARAALVWEWAGRGERGLEALIVLDLGADPARTDFAGRLVLGLHDATEPPAMHEGSGDALAVYLGERHGRRWYLLITHREAAAEPLDGRERNDLYFLAGECAGLLFHRDLDQGIGDE